MKKTRKTTALALGLMFLGLPIAQAGGWTQKKGQGYFKLGQSYLRANQFYEEGKTVDIITTGVYFTSLYGEYGLSDKWTGVVYFPFFSRMTVNNVEFASGRFQEGDEYNGLGDTDIGLKYGLLQDTRVKLAASVTLGLPLGETAGGETGALQTGDGEFNQLFRLEAGYALNNAPIYFNAGVGINNRTNNFSEEFRYNFEVGYSKNKFLAALKLDGIESFQNGETGGSMSGVFSNNIEYFSITPEVAYTVKGNIGLTANVGMAVTGSRVLAAPNYGFGIFMNVR